MSSGKEQVRPSPRTILLSHFHAHHTYGVLTRRSEWPHRPRWLATSLLFVTIWPLSTKVPSQSFYAPFFEVCPKLQSLRTHISLIFVAVVADAARSPSEPHLHVLSPASESPPADTGLVNLNPHPSDINWLDNLLKEADNQPKAAPERPRRHSISETTISPPKPLPFQALRPKCERQQYPDNGSPPTLISTDSVVSNAQQGTRAAAGNQQRTQTDVSTNDAAAVLLRLSGG
jgi:hypothetical protein